MPATSSEALAAKRARDAQRRRDRLASDPAYRELLNAQRTAQRRKRNGTLAHNGVMPRDSRPFVGCDGEGIRRDGRSHYALFRMGDRVLGPKPNDRRLLTPELLEFIVRHPSADDILIAFAFDYDASNILFDVPHTREREGVPSRLERLLRIEDVVTQGIVDPHKRKDFFRWVWLKFDGYGEFGVEYLPRNYLKVCRAETVMRDGRPFTRAIKGTTRTIYDAFGFFQSSFLRALELWDIGKAHRERIAAMKAQREAFATITPQIARYCRIECELLAEMMEAFRTMSLAAGIRPRTWNGAGKLATALHNDHATMTREQVVNRLPGGLIATAHAAYYGGRFEVTRVGKIDQAVWEQDISSAYPAAMLDLPCLEHGRWKRASAGELQAELHDTKALFVCRVSFAHPPKQFLCGLPFRSDKGKLAWPRHGKGTYWSVELRSAARLGAAITCHAGWRYERRCDCKPFAWVKALYIERKRIGKARRGIPIKLAINSLYGKLAQRVGHPKFQNPIWAGLITAITRAKLNDAIRAAGQRNVVMIATDAVYTINRPAKVRIGDDLGQWERKDYPSLFIVKPGLYWAPEGKAKSRGLSPKFFEPLTGEFEIAWHDWMSDKTQVTLFADGAMTFRDKPVVAVAINSFVSLRLAYRRGDPESLCQWQEHKVGIQFEWRDKRGATGKRSRDGKHMILAPLGVIGDGVSRSNEYTASARQAWMAELEDQETYRLYGQDNPDPLDITPPFR